jgi:hypothetical protein
MRKRIAAGVVTGLTALGLVTTFATADAMTQSAAAKKLSHAHVTWSSSGHCTSKGNPHCTSFSGIRADTVSGVVTLKKSSKCKINITGGTETGHQPGTYSHGNGYKVDIAHNSCVDHYIKKNFSYIGLRGDGYPQWRSSSGNVYCDEGSHWDITFY